MKINEVVKPKIKTVRPGVEVEIDNGDGTETKVDLRKNPSAITKTDDGKVKLNKDHSKDPAPERKIKPGQEVEVDDESK